MFDLERKDADTREIYRGELGVPQEIKLDSLDAETGEFEGYGAKFNNVDFGGDLIAPGAFAESLKRKPAGRIKMLHQHRHAEVLGRWTDAYEDENGLYMKGRFTMKNSFAAGVHALVADGALDGMSIGYRTIKADPVEAGSDFAKAGARRILTELELHEVSVVTFPMNEQAMINRVKNGALMTERDFERLLMREAGLSSSEAKCVIAKGFRHLQAEREAGIDGQESSSGILEALRDARAAFG